MLDQRRHLILMDVDCVFLLCETTVVYEALAQIEDGLCRRQSYHDFA